MISILVILIYSIVLVELNENTEFQSRSLMFLNIFLFMKCRFQGSVSFWDWLSGFGVQWIATSFRCSVVFRCTLFVTDLCWTFVKNNLIMYLFKSFWLCYWYGLRDGMSVHRFGPDWYISATVGWHFIQTMTSHDSLTFPLVLPRGSHFCL